MDDEAVSIIEFDELKRLRDQIKNLKLENDKLRQRNLPTLSDHKLTVWTNPEPEFERIVEKDGDDVLADVLEIDEFALADDETWLSPARGGPSGADLTTWLRHDANPVAASTLLEDNRLYSDLRRTGVDCRTFTRRKTPARPPLRFSPVARGFDSTFRVLSEPHLNLTQELRLLETSSSQDELNGTYHISGNHMDEFMLSDQVDEFHLSSQRAELYESSNLTNVFHASNGRRELQMTLNQRQESHSTPSKREVLVSTSEERAALRSSQLRGASSERQERSSAVNRRSASWDSLDERPMDDVRSMARLQEQSLQLAMSTPHQNRALRQVAVDDDLPSPIVSETSSSSSSRTGSASNVSAGPRVLPNELPKMKPVSAAAAASRPGGRASGLPRPMSRIPAPRARKPAWADGCY